MHTKSRARRTRTRQAELFEDPAAADSGRADKAGPKAVPQLKRKAAAPPKKRREDAQSMAARQREISVSEFFTKNRHLLGFDNPSKALLTAVRELAAAIPDCRMVSIEGNYINQPGRTGRAIREFLAPDLQEPSNAMRVTTRSLAQHPGASSLRTVLFTDLVGHTEMMSRLGDEGGRAVLREHERITRDVLKEHGGTEVKTMGDGFMASFSSVTKAVECAIALQRAFADMGNSAVPWPAAAMPRPTKGWPQLRCCQVQG